MNAVARKRLGELLVDAGIIDETQLKAALGHQRQWGVRLGQALVDLKLATEQEIVKVLARRFGFEVARLDQVEAYAHQQAIQLVPREFAVRYNVFPLGADTSTLSVAMSDPSNLAVVDELRFRSGRRVKVSIGGDREISAAIQAAFPSPDGAVEAIALDIEDAGEGEPVLTSFGGGSSEAFDSFFGAESTPPDAGELGDPFAAGPAEAPVAVPASQTGAFAAMPAPFPVSLDPGPAAPLFAPAAQAAAAPVAPAAAAHPPSAPAPAATPQQPSAFAAPTARAAPAPRPAPPAVAPAPATRPAAPTTPAVRAAPATAIAPRPAAAAPGPAPAAGPGAFQQPRPASTAPTLAPAPSPAPAAAPRPALAELELELPSADAVREARPARGPAPAAPATAMPSGKAQAPVLGEEEELTPLSEDVEVTNSHPLPTAAARTHAEQAILDALERLADGGRAEPEVLKPTQLMAVLARLLVRKGLVTERELLDALLRPGEDA